MYGLCREDNWKEAIRQCHKYNLLGLENILLDYFNIYVRILNVLYSIKGEHGQSIFIDNSFLNKVLRKSIDKYIHNKEIGSILEYLKKYKINLELLDEENFLIDNMGEIKNAIKYKNT